MDGLGELGLAIGGGMDRGLSRYQSIYDMVLKGQANKRQQQHQALQSLIHGSALAQSNPDVAEAAMNNPDIAEILPTDAMTAGVKQARTLRAGASAFGTGIANDNIDTNDPNVQALIASDPLKYSEFIKKQNDQRRLRQILNDPNMDPNERMRLMTGMGALKLDPQTMGMMYPSIPATVKATERGAVMDVESAPQVPGGVPRNLRAHQNEATGTARGKSDVALENEPYSGMPRGLTEASNTAFGTERGTLRAGAMPIGGDRKPADSGFRFKAEALETPADATRKLRTGQTDTTNQQSQALNRNRVQARSDVRNQLAHIPKDVWNSVYLKPETQLQDQQALIDYLTAVRVNALAAQDPMMKHITLPVPPRPAIMDVFEGKLQSTSWWQSIKNLFSSGGTAAPGMVAPDDTDETVVPGSTRGDYSSPTATPTTTPVPGVSVAPPTYQPGQSADGMQPPPGAREGDMVRQKSTGKVFRVENGVMVFDHQE